MILYHCTDHPTEILRDGFKDATGTYLTVTGEEHTGVWLSNWPLDCSEGAKGDVVLSVEIDEGLIAQYEWIEVDKPYREWLVPAELVNRCSPQIVSMEDLERLSRARFGSE